MSFSIPVYIFPDSIKFTSSKPTPQAGEYWIYFPAVQIVGAVNFAEGLWFKFTSTDFSTLPQATPSQLGGGYTFVFSANVAKYAPNASGYVAIPSNEIAIAVNPSSNPSPYTIQVPSSDVLIGSSSPTQVAPLPPLTYSGQPTINYASTMNRSTQPLTYPGITTTAGQPINPSSHIVVHHINYM